jgi:hypothetical protein
MLLALIPNGSEVLAAEKQITLSMEKSLDSPDGRFLSLVYTEAFKRLGISFYVKEAPSQRGSFMADSGEIDGLLSRIYSYNETHPNLIQVEEPHWHSGFLAVAKDSSIQLDGWQSLSNTQYRVTYVRGTEGCERKLPQVVRPKNLERVDTVSQGLKKLRAGWTDIVVSSEMGVINILHSDEFKDSGLRVVGVMEKFSSHAFLHKKHQELVPQLSTVLADMKKEGLLEAYWKAAKVKSHIQTNLDGMCDEK